MKTSGCISSYCKGCSYLGSCSVGKCCDYILVTGQARGCPAGDGCTRREFGSRRWLYDFKIIPSQNDHKYKKPTKAKPQAEKKKRGPHPKPKEEIEKAKAERLSKYRKAAIKYREKMHGRQREVLMAYKAEHNLTCRDIADAIGVHPNTFQKWCMECVPARWDLLEKIGISKPEWRD